MRHIIHKCTELFEYYVSLTDYTRYFSARTYTIKHYFGRKEATFCGHVIQNVIVSS